MKISASLHLILFLFSVLQATNSLNSLSKHLDDKKKVDNREYEENYFLSKPNSKSGRHYEYLNFLKHDFANNPMKSSNNHLWNKNDETTRFIPMKRSSSRVVKKIKPIVYNGYSMDINIDIFKSTVN